MPIPFPLDEENPAWIPLDEENPAWIPLDEENPAWIPLDEEAPVGLEAPTPQRVYKIDALHGMHGFVTASSFWRKAEAWKGLMHEIRTFPGSFAALKVIHKKKEEARDRLAITQAKEGGKRELKKAERALVASAYNRSVWEKWNTVCDILGPPQRWPHSIRRLFWAKTLSYNQRFRLVIFCFNNGLQPQILLDWFSLRKMVPDTKNIRRLQQLVKDLETPTEITKHYYSWDLHCGIDLTIEGLIPSKKRMPNHIKQMQVEHRNSIPYLRNEQH